VKTLRIIVVIHPDGTIDVTIEWICTNPSTGKDGVPLYRGYCWLNDMELQAVRVALLEIVNTIRVKA
jgi:hypothetical protein